MLSQSFPREKIKMPSKNHAIFINFNINDDLCFIFNRFEDAVRENFESSRVVTNSADREVYQNAQSIFPAAPSSSWTQLKILIPLIRILNELRGKTIFVNSPSWVLIFIIPVLRIFCGSLTTLVHDVVPHYVGIKGLIYKVQNSIIFRFSTEIIVFSQYSKKCLAIEHPKVFCNVFPMGSPAIRFSLPPQESIAKQFDFVWWGRWQSYKGTNNLHSIAQQLNKENATLLVITEVNGASNQITQLQKMPNVCIINRRLSFNALCERLIQARINLAPYESATQSGVVEFCSALGIPTLGNRVGALSEQIIDNNNGWLVEDVSVLDNFSKYLESSLTIPDQSGLYRKSIKDAQVQFRNEFINRSQREL